MEDIMIVNKSWLTQLGDIARKLNGNSGQYTLPEILSILNQAVSSLATLQQEQVYQEEPTIE